MHAEYPTRLLEVEAECERLREREAYFTRALAVADGGRYRADWDGAIRNVLADRDAARAEAAELRSRIETLAKAHELRAEETRRVLGGVSGLPTEVRASMAAGASGDREIVAALRSLLAPGEEKGR